MRNDSVSLKLAGFLILAFWIAYKLLPARIFLPANDLPNWYYYSSFQRRAALPAKIVAVAIDDYSMNKMPERWPWKRSAYAELFKALDREGARTIALDVVLKGSSEDAQDDLSVADTLQGLKSKVVLGYDFDFKNLSPGVISDAIPKNMYIPGMLNTLRDQDGAIRKLRLSLTAKSQVYYSLSVMAVSAFLDKPPEKVVSSLRSIKDSRFRGYSNFQDNYFYINYTDIQHQKDRSIPVVSFYDIIHNMEQLKIEWGRDLFNDSLVIVYPATEIRHDIHPTPLGKMFGGFVHINGIINILSGSGVYSPGFIPVAMLLLSALMLFLAIRTGNFSLALTTFAAVIAINVFSALILWKFHIKTDFFRVVAFATIFYASATAYQSLIFLARLAAIKDRATIDPLRGLYTLRYFRYRLELESRRRKLRLIMVHMKHFRENTEDIAIDVLKDAWVRIHSALSKVQRYWAGYSMEEIVGFSSDNPRRLEAVLTALHDDISEIFAGLELKVEVRICAVECKKDGMFSDMFSTLARHARSLTANVLVLPSMKMLPSGQVSAQTAGSQSQFLDGFAEDIEEKNRQLMNLYEKLKAEHDKTKEAFYQIITSLVNALEARDPYTQGHSRRVANYALLMAERLGWDQEQKDRLHKASLLHDLGKIGIPDSILHKKDKLTDEEFNFIKQHEIFAINILKPLKELDEILPWILYHHEKWDGTGYPYGLGADAIPVASQIIALSDVYDALTTGRDYKKSLSKQDAIAIILKDKGTHFSPDLADIFVSVIP